MDLKYSQIAQLSNFSNDRMVEVIKTKLAESENAAVSLVFDDKLIVLDEASNDFYSVDYKVENKALKLSGWEKVRVLPDNDTRLEELSEGYFDPLNDSPVTVKDLVEAFRLKYADEPYRKLINRTAIEKRSIVESNAKIKALNEVRKVRSYFSDDIKDILEDTKISTLHDMIRESDSVQNSVTRVDFRNPVAISLFEETTNRVINLSAAKQTKIRSGNIRKKVKNLWTSESFKEDMGQLVKDLSESDNVKDTISRFFNQHKEILVLEENEVEDLVLKTALMLGEANTSDYLVSLFSDYYNLDEAKEAKNDFIKRNRIDEADDEDVDLGGEEAEEPGEDEKDQKEKTKETAIDEDSINKILKVMNKILENLEDKTMEAKYVQAFIKALEDAKVGSIGEGKLKEIIDFLSSVYDQAQSDNEEE